MTTPELPPLPVVAYLYHDGESAETLSPLLHSIGLVVASDRRKEWRNETPLTTLAHADSARAPLVAEVERLRAEVDRMQNRAVIDDDAAIERALTSLAWDNDNTRWPDAYSEEEQQMERENMRRAFVAANKADGPRAYCRACQAVGMSNCAHFDECAGSTCITCHRPTNAKISAEVDRLRSRVAELEAAQAPMPIETAPVDGEFLIYAAGLWWPAYQYEARGVYSNAHGRVNNHAALHPIKSEYWMPKPPPPQKEQGND